MTSTSRVALVDADVLVYQMAHRAQSPVNWGEGEPPSADLAHAQEGIYEAVQQCRDDTESDAVLMCLTPSGTPLFRHLVYPEYKQHRKKADRPALYSPLRAWILDSFTCVERSGLEADDVMGILATSVTPLIPKNAERVVCTVDKDLRTVPGYHYNWRKPGAGVEFVSEPEADFMFYCQALHGDMTDNYPGCPMVGPRRAEQALREFRHDDYFDGVGAWERIVETYGSRMPFTREEKKVTIPDMEEVRDFALTMARCARILRGSDYNFKTKKPILWEPPCPSSY
jgi:DNA polymerase-1